MREVCSLTGTHTRTGPLPSTAGLPVVNARPAGVPVTGSAGTPSVIGKREWRAKSAR